MTTTELERMVPQSVWGAPLARVDWKQLALELFQVAQKDKKFVDYFISHTEWHAYSYPFHTQPSPVTLFSFSEIAWDFSGVSLLMEMGEAADVDTAKAEYTRTIASLADSDNIEKALFVLFRDGKLSNMKVASRVMAIAFLAQLRFLRDAYGIANDGILPWGGPNPKPLSPVHPPPPLLSPTAIKGSDLVKCLEEEIQRGPLYASRSALTEYRSPERTRK